MNKQWFTNTTKVEIGGKKPGERFRLNVDETSTPLDLYWRKRLADGDIRPDGAEQAKIVPEPAKAARAAKAAPDKSI